MSPRSGLTNPRPMPGDDIEVVWRFRVTIDRVTPKWIYFTHHGWGYRVLRRNAKQYSRNNHYWITEQPEKLK